MYAGIEISVILEARDLLLFGWACRILENFNGKGPDFKEMGVRACLCIAVISYTASMQRKVKLKDWASFFSLFLRSPCMKSVSYE